MAASISDWNELLPELLEKILGMVNDRDTALSARLVNSLWKAEMDKQMEKACLATWTDWKSPRATNLSPTAAFSQVVIWKDDNEPVATASVCDTKGQNLIKSNCNPFPTKSLVISDFMRREFVGNEESAKRFFEQHGAKVANFCLETLVDAKDIHQFLTWFPNLKGVQILISLVTDNDIKFIKKTSPPALQHLEHLNLGKFLVSTKESRQCVRWIMEAYGENLVSLFLTGSNMNRLQENKKNKLQEESEFRPRFHKLAYLKVANPGGSFFKSSASFPQLTHLLVSQTEAPISFKGLRVIMDFIDKCAATLVHLNLEVIIGELKNPEFGVLEKDPPQIFPKLTSFIVRFPTGVQDDALLLKRAFLSRFPALRSLEFHGYSDTFNQMTRMQLEDVFVSKFKACVLADLFNNCVPMLQKIYLCHVDNLGKVTEMFTITKDS